MANDDKSTVGGVSAVWYAGLLSSVPECTLMHTSISTPRL